MKSKSKQKYEEVTLDELTNRYMRSHRLDVARGSGAETIEDHFQCALLLLSIGRFKTTGQFKDKYLIPLWSDLSEKNLVEKEVELNKEKR